ncbi:MAG TPA: hypothetical protein VLT32_11325, partial [Candidatus Sulfomarinibacteraceae bacterium]|nr:hypothetical protein [Candidatus Sulfomarinibacteraceae bacterium]
MSGIPRRLATASLILIAAALLAGPPPAIADVVEEYEHIDSSACADCHEASTHGTLSAEDLAHSVHEGLDCLDCHTDRDTVPHRQLTSCAVCDSCSTCHDVEAA